MNKKFLKRNLCISLSSFLLTGELLFAQESTKLDEVNIIENAISSYQSEEKIKLNRTGIDIEDTAKSIQVFNEAFIQDANLQNIDDIIELSSNTVYTGNTDGKSTNISMRGFSSVPILIDGLKVTNKIPNPEVFALDSVEVQKGPDSLQYGQSSPGGIVNLVKKKPSKESMANLEFEINDNPSYKPKIDITGSLNKNKSLYYKLISTYKYDKGYTNSNTNTNKIFIAPSLAYDINDNNTFTFISEYNKETSPTNFGTNVNSKGELVAPIKNVTSHPDEEFERTQKVLGFDFDSKYNTWSSNFKYRYIKHIRDYGNVYLPLMYNEATNEVTRFPANQRGEFKEHALQYTFNKEFQILNIKNNISIGADYNKSTSQGSSNIAMHPYNINLSNPVYEQHINPVDSYNITRDMSQAKTSVKSWGMFLQDSINLTDKLIFNAGLRYSESKPQEGQKSDAITPSFGLVYHITNKTSLYTSYSESFTPNSAIDKSGNVLDPETGKGYEFGIKQKLFNDKLNLTTAVFKIEKENIALADPNAPSLSGWSVPSGKQESHGFEIDLVGDITQNWSMIASYGYTKTKDKNNDDNNLRNIPKHTANIFTKYKLSAFDLANFYVGAGARYIGSKYADDANSIKLDSTIVYNATIGYKKGNWKANLSVQNLTDEEYVDGSASGTTSDTRVYIGEPRAVLATISYKF
ncbi:TonB-dependent siderophore receptor [Malaciobacter marinus]|uniref:TonB-dependent siderophore receptor n=1 Tax=Malaciobacter marinus TaxID=505249 RepID=A0A347THZ4_9BACT|nr:TonB-dependent receptor [Malaciobacter marinus]AXX86222.1 TonB-dependent siderophore receptor [Malaciobacter marinus]PHO16726.1 TonB-dependent siderophore receptor [Malaciobacter marinus]